MNRRRPPQPRRPKRTRSALWALHHLIVLALASLLTACAGSPSGETAGRVLVLGFDGLDPSVLAAQIEKGRLPNFDQIRRAGASAPFSSLDPMLSPLLWTTIATGREPLDHGVTNFVVRAADGSEQPITRLERKVPAIWNRASHGGLESTVVGWWATWPAEQIQGAVVSDRAALHFLLTDNATSGLEVPGVTYPPELSDTLATLMTSANDLPDDLVESFVNRRAETASHATPGSAAPGSPAPDRFSDDQEHLLWSLAAGLSHHRIGRHLWREHQPDLHLVYYEFTDTLAHLFGHLHERSDLYGELAEQQALYGQAVTAAYALADQFLGEVIGDLDERTTLIIVSDHGFRLGELPDDTSATRDMRRVSHESHELAGTLLLYGHRVQPGDSDRDTQLVDVAPTILDLLNLPVPEDLPGRTLVELFTNLDTSRRIQNDAVPLETADAVADAAAPALLDKLRSLGYIGGASGTENLPSRNEASLALRDGDYRRAARIFKVLSDAEPEVAGHQVGLATALSQMGRTELALEAFGRAIDQEPTLAPAYFNRGLLEARLGNEEQAVADYRTVLKLDPDHSRARGELQRLGRSVTGRIASTPEDLENARLLDEARQASQRGDLETASALLDRLEARAADNPAVHEYRSNVEYLRGNLTASREALRRAIEIDPENPRTRANLRRLNERLGDGS